MFLISLGVNLGVAPQNGHCLSFPSYAEKQRSQVRTESLPVSPYSLRFFNPLSRLQFRCSSGNPCLWTLPTWSRMTAVFPSAYRIARQDCWIYSAVLMVGRSRMQHSQSGQSNPTDIKSTLHNICNSPLRNCSII